MIRHFQKMQRLILLMLKVIFTALLMCFALYGCTNTKNPAPVVKLGLKNDNKAGTHVVQKNDTVFDIAQRYKISMQSLIRLNNISSPYTIYKGDRLILPPPQTYRVREGDSLYSISRTFGVDMTRLTRANNIKVPYAIYPNQVLTLPDNLSEQVSISSMPSNPKTVKAKAVAKKEIQKIASLIEELSKNIKKKS